MWPSIVYRVPQGSCSGVLLVSLHLAGREYVVKASSKKLSIGWLAVGPNLLDSLVTHVKRNPDRIASGTAFDARAPPSHFHRQALICCRSRESAEFWTGVDRRHGRFRVLVRRCFWLSSASRFR